MAHIWRFGPDRRFIIDSWSRVGLLPHVAVLDAATGKQTNFLQKEELGPREQGRYLFPERFVAKGRDNKTDIYGIIVRPPNFEKTAKYTVIEIIYAHLSQFITPKHFRNFSPLRDRAKDGYIVVRIDSMGTNWRSKAFRIASNGCNVRPQHGHG